MTSTALTRRSALTLAGGLCLLGSFQLISPSTASAMTASEQDFLSRAAAAAQAARSVAPSVPASPIIAQAILESGWGTTQAASYDNYFGAKANLGDNDPYKSGSVLLSTQEEVNGETITSNDWFYVYPSMEASMKSHFMFVTGQTGVSAYATSDRPTDPKAFVRWLVTPPRSYATDSAYVEKLIGIMDRYNLYQYDAPTAAFVWTHRVVNAETVNVRSQPGGTIITTVDAGARLYLIGPSSGDWVLARFEGGTQGWIYNEYINAI